MDSYPTSRLDEHHIHYNMEQAYHNILYLYFACFGRKVKLNKYQ